MNREEYEAEFEAIEAFVKAMRLSAKRRQPARIGADARSVVGRCHRLIEFAAVDSQGKR